MENAGIPDYFVCPISHQIMQDPVTTITGITYDRPSIEQWLFSYKKALCPITRQPLPPSSELIPNHSLRRLIQSWSASISNLSQKSFLDKSFFINLMRDLDHPDKHKDALKRLQKLREENEGNKKGMVEAGVPKALVLFIADCCYQKRRSEGLPEALDVLRFVGFPKRDQCKALLGRNCDVIQSFTWVLTSKKLSYQSKSHAVWALKSLFDVADALTMESLDEDFFFAILTFLKVRASAREEGIKLGLQVLLEASRFAVNRAMMVHSGAVFRLTELETESKERLTTEIVLGILANLCSCSEGRAHIMSNRYAIEMVSQRILEVSGVADDRALAILLAICKNSMPNQNSLKEILNANSLKKVCVLLQPGRSDLTVEHKAKEILKHYFTVTKLDPCTSFTLF